MVKHTSLFLLLLGLNGITFAQTDSISAASNNIGLAVGYNQGYLKDLNFSALNYQEAGLIYSLNYLHQKPQNKSKFEMSLDFGLPRLKTSASDYFTSEMTFANIAVSYVRLVIDRKLKLYVGGQYATYLHVLDWNDLESFSFLVSHGIGFKSEVNYNPLAKHQFRGTLFIPVFQNLVIPPYNGLDVAIIENQDNIAKLIIDGMPSSFNSYRAFELSLGYNYTVSKLIDLSFDYTLRYQSVPGENQITHLQNQLSAGANIKF